MKPLRRLACLLPVLAIFTAVPAHAEFPDKPIHFVVPFGPGSATDQLARALGQAISIETGQQVIIDNKPGGNGFIGAEAAARAPADGYTVFITTNTTHAAAEHLYRKLPYDPVKDFAPITLINKRSAMLLVNAGFPARNFKEYIAYAKANPGKINFGTSGGGGIFHIAGAWLHSITGTQATFVHYKGAGPMNTDLVAGRVDAAPGLPFVVAPFVKSGKVVPVCQFGALAIQALIRGASTQARFSLKQAHRELAAQLRLALALRNIQAATVAMAMAIQ